jgi:circadian clock protein KaiC
MQDLSNDLTPSGVPGLDEVLGGGLRPGRVYFVEGETGSGKTTLALQFALAGVAAQERVLVISLSESSHELKLIARSHGWSLDGLTVLDLTDTDSELGTTTLFHVSEVHLEQRIQALTAEIAAQRPQRLVIDTLSSLRVLSDQPGQLRRHLEQIQRQVTEMDCTTLVADELGGNDLLHPRSLAWGILRLEQQLGDYGASRRRLHLPKLRGQSYSGGYHDFRIRTGGIEVYPRLRALAAGAAIPQEQVSSGIAALDTLLGGGIERGTSVAVLGPPGCGKSTLCTQLGVAFAQRGERAAIYLFDESVEVFRLRARTQALDLEGQGGHIEVRSVNPAELTPGEFASDLARTVRTEGIRLVIIDSLNGYLQAMPDERFMTLHVHDLLSFLARQGVIAMMTMAQSNATGGALTIPVELSYLADTVITQRYFEATGSIRYAISVLKKRYGDHERTIREYRIGSHGLTLGEPLTQFSGVLLASPAYTGGEARLL